MLHSNKKYTVVLLFIVLLLISFFVGCKYKTVQQPIEIITVAQSQVAEENPLVTLEEPEPAKELISSPVTFEAAEYKVFYDIELSNNYIAELTDYMQVLITAIESEEYTREAEVSMQSELSRISDIINQLESDVARYSTWEYEYYYAAKTYEFFRQNGYSAEIACAIIGNMMIETSGGTLSLNPTIYNPSRSFYGLCQWSLYYRPNVADMSFENQLVYLHNDMEKEFKTFGFCYQRGFTYEDFLAMENVGEAAIAFAKVYERCGSSTYTMRANCAKIAYEYFNGERY